MVQYIDLLNQLSEIDSGELLVIFQMYCRFKWAYLLFWYLWQSKIQNSHNRRIFFFFFFT